MLYDGFRDSRKSHSGRARRKLTSLRLPRALFAFGLLSLALACSQTAGRATATPGQVLEPQAVPQTPTGPPPKVDTSISSVDLEDIFFDTFDGRFIRLSEASDEIIETLRDAITPVYVPKYQPVSGGDWLQPDDLVVGSVSRGEAFAYPIKILNIHEIVNDVIDGVPVLVSYCPLCASGVVYSRNLDGQVLLFGNTCALFESDLVMYDHQTGSYWFQVIGAAIVGPLTGKRLRTLPSATTTWGQWSGLHPDTQVLSRNLGLVPESQIERVYSRDLFASYSEAVNRGQFSFPVTEEKLDDRLLPGERVFAIEIDESHKAYALGGDADEVINDEVGGVPVVVIVRTDGPTASAYVSTLDGQKRDFTMNLGILEDTETGSQWDDAGRATSGLLFGAQLTPVPSRYSLWFSLADSVPGIDLYEP